MGDMAEEYRAYDTYKKDKKKGNLMHAREILAKYNIKYTESNNGYHFLIPHQNTIIDFYPTTGKIYDKSTQYKARGIFTLLAYMEIIEPGN